MEKYCKSCGRVFKNSDFKICPYCGNQLSTRAGRQPIPRKLRHQVFQRDGYRCRECGATNKETRLHVDHIKPVAKGGTNDLSNLQTLCEECNRAKYTDEWIGGKVNYNMQDNNQNKVGRNKTSNSNRHSNFKQDLNKKMEFVLSYYSQTHSLRSAAKQANVKFTDILRWMELGKLGNKLYLDFYKEMEWIDSHNFKRKNILFDLDECVIEQDNNYEYKKRIELNEKRGEEYFLSYTKRCPNCNTLIYHNCEKCVKCGYEFK